MSEAENNILARKPRAKPAPYDRVKKTGPKPKDVPQTSAVQPNAVSRKNLTLADKLEVLAYVNDHKSLSQGQVVTHFATRTVDRLIFSQSTLSRMVLDKENLEQRALANPTALSSKRPRQVTHPGVEKALWTWFKDMEAKGETVSGPMLVEKRTRFENLFNVPAEQRLEGDGWLPSFCRTYKIKEHRRHGEAGSVDLAAVEVERKRCQLINVKFALKDIFNFDEMAAFAFAPPDRGLATQQLSGKKKDKFRITLGFAVNADGTEKLPIFFIGRSKTPRCFEKKGPVARGFYYRHNKKAWMNMELFEEWIKLLDRQMKREKRKVLLWIDNFSGHKVAYEPANIQMEFFEPNMTSFVQPLDAGIIRCYKAHYRKYFCIRALDLDEAGEANIYKINLLEAMLMIVKAWEAVGADTIAHCWEHTQIMFPGNVAPEEAQAAPAAAPSLHMACNILREFAASDMTLPDAEKRLQAHLGAAFAAADWKPAFDAIFAAEDDTDAAIASIEELAPPRTHTIRISTRNTGAKPLDSPAHELIEAEAQLLISVEELRARNRIHSIALTIDELLNGLEEDLIGEVGAYVSDEAIVAAVQHADAVARGEIEEIDVDAEPSDAEEDEGMSASDVLALAEQLGRVCIKHGPDSALSTELSKLLVTFRGQLRTEQSKNAKQTSLTRFFGPK